MTGESGARSQHTPGPWRWNFEEPLILESATSVEHEYGEMGSVLSTYPAAVLVCTEQPGDDDADLIAAAPDLYTALLALYEASLHTLDRAYEDVRGQVEAALKKAEGQS